MDNEKIYHIEFNTKEMGIKETVYIIDKKINNHYKCRREDNNTHHAFHNKLINSLIYHGDVYSIYCKDEDLEMQRSIIQTIAKEVSNQKQEKITNFLNNNKILI